MIRIRCGCKINLGLKITGRREDGFHTIESVFFPVSWPADDVVFMPIQGGGLHFTANIASLENRHNLVARAYDIFCEASGCQPDIAIHLHKRIPSGAGLGGGSSDAAHVLMRLNQMAGSPLDERKLWTTAAALGADVPFFLFNRPALVTGIGEILRPLPLPPPWHVVIVWPDIFVSTQKAFSLFDARGPADPASSPHLTKTARKDKKICFYGASGVLRAENDLEPVVFQIYPELAALKTRMLALGAIAASMSGSGSAIFGLFEEKDQALAAARHLKALYAFVYFSRLVSTGM